MTCSEVELTFAPDGRMWMAAIENIILLGIPKGSGFFQVLNEGEFWKWKVWRGKELEEEEKFV